MTTRLLPFPRFKAFDQNAGFLAGGKLFSFSAGTSTPKDTYTDAGGLTPNPNPVVMDGSGEADIWLGSGAYKFELTDADDVVQWTVDDVAGTLNADTLEAKTWEAPGTIGSTTPNTGAFSSLTSHGLPVEFCNYTGASAVVTNPVGIDDALLFGIAPSLLQINSVLEIEARFTLGVHTAGSPSVSLLLNGQVMGFLNPTGAGDVGIFRATALFYATGLANVHLDARTGSGNSQMLRQDAVVAPFSGFFLTLRNNNAFTGTVGFEPFVVRIKK